MNKGDKVICIKEHMHYRRYNNTIKHIKGNIYEILGYSVKTILISSESSEGLWFDMINSDDNINYNFSEYFITLAEWRDKQINSILNE